ncbi:MAG: diaminopimelate epimerase [Planctomycetia bacterium]|nr:diaminopimelate epimerase [Planctomycetia bacterium]
MRFTKMHGAGNDYVYVDCFREPAPADPEEVARQVSDRHSGIGGDGLILICPSEVADARMRMFNADGSEAEMCGNGIRCVAKYVYDHGICQRPTLRIETKAGVLPIDLEVVDGLVERARVDMGRPVLDPARIPVEFPRPIAEKRVVDFPADLFIPLNPPSRWMEDCGLDLRMTCVSMGNPHVVFYCTHVAAVPLATVGPMIERQPIFPQRINVHFVEVHSPDEVTMRTWERGSGITLACGTGASAVCVAGALSGRTARRILAHLPGGDLELDWAHDDHVYMTGPAVEVFSGEWSAEESRQPAAGGRP